MTCKEIGEYVSEQEKAQKERIEVMSSLEYRIAEMLIVSNGMCVKKPKIMKFDELFPEFKHENNISKEKAIENKWKAFLGVV